MADSSYISVSAEISQESSKIETAAYNNNANKIHIQNSVWIQNLHVRLSFDMGKKVEIHHLPDLPYTI